MSFDSLYNSNPNLKLKILQDLVDEYKGFIAGAKVQNELGIFGSDDIQNALDLLEKSGLTNSILGNSETDIEKIQKSIVNKYMYSSGGGYQIHDLLGNLAVFDNVPKNALKEDKDAAGQNIDEALVVLFEDDQKLSQYSQIVLKEGDAYEANHDYFYQMATQAFEQDRIDALASEDDGQRIYTTVSDVQPIIQKQANETRASMKKMLSKYTFEDNVLEKREFEPMMNGEKGSALKKLADYLFEDYLKKRQEEEAIENARKKAQGEDIKEEEKLTKEQLLNEFKDNVLPIPSPFKKTSRIKKDFINRSIREPSPTSPSLSAIVIKKPSMSLNSRNDNFLSIFFGAVSQLELSRCTPFLKLTFFNDSGTKKGEPYRDYLDNVAYMKFSGGKDGVFSVGDEISINEAMPTFSQADISKDRIGPVGHMDIFTAPQTMVNANINNHASSFDNLANLSSGQGSHIENLDNVLDPFAPMMSLKNFNITVQGGQYYLVTNRRATMSVVLHDRSRLADISPFISLNEVARTIVRVEHGWSHPEGDIIRSKNPIGRFLNSMRETCYYQLTSSDFTFNGNSVTINMTLDFFGFTNFVDANIAFGEKRPLTSSSLQKKLARAFDDITNSAGFKKTKIKPPAEGEEIKEEVKKQQREQHKKQGRVIKTLKVLRTHSQNSQLAVDTEKAQKFEAFIDSKFSKDDNRKLFPVDDPTVFQFFKKLFDLLEITNMDTSPFKQLEIGKEPTINDLKEALGKEGFTKAINEHLRFSYAKEVIDKIESLIGYDYNVTEYLKETEKKVSFSPDPVKTKEDIKKEQKEKEKQKEETKPSPVKTERIVNIGPVIEDGEVKKKNLTPDYFLSTRCLKSGAKFEGLNAEGSRVKYTSLGKLICGLVALPSIAVSTTYSEVQVFFYPINNQAAGARKYTTASLPVNNQELLLHVEKAIEGNYELTLKGFFELISNMFEDNSLSVYGVSAVGEARDKVKRLVDEALQKDKNANPPHKEAFKQFKESGIGSEPQNDKERQVAFNNYKKKLTQQYTEQFSDELNLKALLTKIYEKDNCGFAPTDKFVKPILQMEIESIPAIIPRKSNAVSSDTLLDLYAQEFSYNFLSPNQKDINALTGIDDSKRILRIHIYDSNSTQKPFEKIAMESAIEFDKFLPFVGQLNEKVASKDFNMDQPVSKDSKKTIGGVLRQVQGDLTKAFRKMSPNELKQYMIRSFPTIRYGSQIAVVKQISVRSNTSDSIINARLMNEIKAEFDKKKANIEKGNQVKSDFTTFVIPTSVDITLYGCPFITVGNCIYLDLGTGTDIDNIYMVTDVTHSIGPGDYTTSITVAMPAQGTVKSTQDRIVTMINAVGEVKEEGV